MHRKLATLTRRLCQCWCLPEKVSVEATVRMSLCVGTDDTSCEDDMEALWILVFTGCKGIGIIHLNGGGEVVMCCFLRCGLAV